MNNLTSSEIREILEDNYPGGSGFKTVAAQSFERYYIGDVFDMLGKDNLNIQTIGSSPKESIGVDGYKVYTKSLRYATFYQKGTKCACCGKEGTHFRLDCDKDSDPTATNRRHFNLYADDGTLMTKDHIIPKKLGGKDRIDNLQTLCEDCNKAKGHKADFEIKGIVATNQNNPEHKLYFQNIEDAVFYMTNRIMSKPQYSRKGTLVRKTIQLTMELYLAVDANIVYRDYIWKSETFNANLLKR